MRRERSLSRARTHEIELAISGRGLRGEIKRWTNRTNVHGFPKDVSVGNVFAVYVDLPFPCRIVVQHPAQKRNMQRHFLFAGEPFRFLRLPLPGGNIIGQQAAPDAFKKIAFSPRSTRKTDIKGELFSAFESPDDFLWRGSKTETARQVIRCTKREYTQRNAAIDHPAANFSDRPVAACSKNEISGFLQSFFVIAFFGRLISGVMSGFGQRRHQLLFAVLGISGLRIVHQCDSHALFGERILPANYSAKTTLTLVSY